MDSLTSTFAWFQAAASVTASAGTATGAPSISVSGPTDVATSLAITVNCTVAPVDAEEVLILSTWDSTTLKSYTADANKTVHPYTPSGKQVQIRYYSVSAKYVFSGTDPYGELTEALSRNTQTYTVTFSRSSGSDRVKFWTQENTTDPTADGSATSLQKAVKDLTTSDTTIGYLAVRVEGGAVSEGATNVIDTAAVTAVIGASGSV